MNHASIIGRDVVIYNYLLYLSLNKLCLNLNEESICIMCASCTLTLLTLLHFDRKMIIFGLHQTKHSLLLNSNQHFISGCIFYANSQEIVSNKILLRIAGTYNSIQLSMQTYRLSGCSNKLMCFQLMCAWICERVEISTRFIMIKHAQSHDSPQNIMTGSITQYTGMLL